MRRALLPILLALTAAAAPAGAGVSVVEDETFFTLRAPAAQEVYLVGDFNNWNPTVEPMQREDDAWVISLFLVPGTYRYKFVVDGEWIVDPDNPGDPEKGSYLTIEERPGGYALSTDEPEPETGPAAAVVTPEVRYIGEFRFDDGDGDAFQLVDLYLPFEREHLRGLANLQSFDDTWKWSPPSADIDIAGAFVEVSAGALTMRGFESDSSWTSRGPVTLVGRDGVFDYNAGFDRHGVSAELSPSETIIARAYYADRHEDENAGAPEIAGDALAGAAGDTTVYAISDATAGADQGALELVVDASDFALGYVMRVDRGLHPGLLADVSRSDSTARVFSTRENRRVSLYWARLKKLYGFELTAGYGRGGSDVVLERSGTAAVRPGEALTDAAAAGDTDGERPLVDSDRVVVTLRRELVGVVWDAGWDRVDFEFDRSAGASGTAVVHRWSAGAAWARGRWSAAMRLRVTDQDYDDTPDALHIDSPLRNVWLFGRDEFEVGDIAALGHDRYARAGVALAWSGGDAAPPYLPREATAAVTATGEGVLESVELLEASARLRFVRGTAHGDYYTLLDGRLAAYDREDWGVSETFASGWVEAGFRRGWIDVNVGWGFDPVVYDPVPNEYNDIGRERWLRGAIASGVRRGEDAAIGARLVALERALEAVNTVKLECILNF